MPRKRRVARVLLLGLAAVLVTLALLVAIGLRKRYGFIAAL
ncbi:MAG TPA: hypothetical protein VG820_07385 [Fimbriimonadaceae bacterium]|nr:hypothetical protein [Fimbriimonadaceae bacterium]